MRRARWRRLATFEAVPLAERRAGSSSIRAWAAAAGAGFVLVEAAAQGLWTAPGAFITPHTAGETRRYEDNVLDILMENLSRQWRGEATLLNQVV